MQHITLNIDGMTCNGCVASVTKILQGVDGVASAEVSLADKRGLPPWKTAVMTLPYKEKRCPRRPAGFFLLDPDPASSLKMRLTIHRGTFHATKNPLPD